MSEKYIEDCKNIKLFYTATVFVFSDILVHRTWLGKIKLKRNLNSTIQVTFEFQKKISFYIYKMIKYSKKYSIRMCKM